jgi:hypothetical protein
MAEELSPSSVKRRLSTLRRIIRFAEAHNHVERNVALLLDPPRGTGRAADESTPKARCRTSRSGTQSGATATPRLPEAGGPWHCPISPSRSFPNTLCNSRSGEHGTTGIRPGSSTCSAPGATPCRPPSHPHTVQGRGCRSGDRRFVDAAGLAPHVRVDHV